MGPLKTSAISLVPAGPGKDWCEHPVPFSLRSGRQCDPWIKGRLRIRETQDVNGTGQGTCCMGIFGERASKNRSFRSTPRFATFGSREGGHPYAGLSAVLATKHDKLPLVAPPLRAAVGLEVHVAQVDTDLLGTFTPEVKRTRTPLGSAIAKARMGMGATGSAIGIASEGSIGLDPEFPLMMSDRELLVLVDDRHGIVITASAASFHVVAETGLFGPEDDLTDFLVRADFPDHKLIVMPNAARRLHVMKGVDDTESLRTCIAACCRLSRDSRARVESDLRAHANPTRRAVIARAGEELASRVARLCPECSAPGWGVATRKVACRCSRCGAPALRAEAWWSCVACPATMAMEGAELAEDLCGPCATVDKYQ